MNFKPEWSRTTTVDRLWLYPIFVLGMIAGVVLLWATTPYLPFMSGR